MISSGKRHGLRVIAAVGKVEGLDGFEVRLPFDCIGRR